MKENAIAMISVGDRPWYEAAAATFEIYAARIGATFLPVRSHADFDFPQMPDRPGRAHKKAYAFKAYVPWKVLERFSRVLMVDDTCCVRPNAPDVFDLVPPGMCGLTSTSRKHASQSFDVIHRFLAASGKPEIAFVPEDYGNSGVMVYDQSMRSAIAPERILDACELLYAKYPHQTLSYYLLKAGGVPCHLLPKRFNTFPAMRLKRNRRFMIEDVLPYLRDDVLIYHVSSAYKHRSRIVQDISRALLGSA